ncbi:MAG: M20/M25/M40 family metallo-hydrolase [Clostridiaceae bacterium]|jgi:tripeptide aminopeptidase|nr:M20/M25/M40 family metallo-hydrolase [Clostridiaceae bacterium]
MINRQRLVDEFISLVKIDSLSKQERKMADALLEKLKDMGYEPYEDETGSKIGGNAGNVICHIKGEKAKPALLLMAHMDTVVPGISKNPSIEGDIIKTDGTTVLGGDDLAGIAVILETVKSLKEDGTPFGDLYVAFTVCEEGGLYGARNLDLSKLPVSYAFILDEGGPIGQIAVKAPFYNRFEVIFQGRAAHAGLEPEKGLSAIMLASKAISDMPNFGRIDEESTSNIGTIKGGEVRNIVCESCKIEGEVRSLSEEKINRYTDEILDHFKTVTESMGGTVQINMERMYPGFNISETDDIISLLKEASKDSGIPLKLHATGGGSDTNIINGAGIPAVNISVGMENVHSKNEIIRISNLEKACHFLTAIIKAAHKR